MSANCQTSIEYPADKIVEQRVSYLTFAYSSYGFRTVLMFCQCYLGHIAIHGESLKKWNNIKKEFV